MGQFLTSDLFVVRELPGVKEGLHWGLAEAVSTLVSADLVVFRDPGIEVSLQRVDAVIDLAAEGHAVELVEHGLVETLDDAVGLRALGLGASVIDVFAAARRAPRKRGSPDR